MHDTPAENTVSEMTFGEKRRDQLLAAPDAVEGDTAPRIEVTEHDGVTRIDIAPDAAVRPGNADDGEHDTPSAGTPAAT